MKLKAKIEDSEHNIDFARSEDTVSIDIDGEKKEFGVTDVGAGSYLFNTDQGVFEAFVTAKNDGEYEVTVGTQTYDLQMFDPKKLRGSTSAEGAHDGSAEIKSAMPGKIVKIMVKVGDQIEVGAGVIVVEAMKMQNELKSPKEGVVKEVRVSEDDRVNAGDLLVTIE